MNALLRIAGAVPLLVASIAVQAQQANTRTVGELKQIERDIGAANVRRDSMTERIYGKTAVVWGRATLAGHRANGTAFRNASRFTDTFVRRDGRWQLVAGHSSALLAPK